MADATEMSVGALTRATFVRLRKGVPDIHNNTFDLVCFGLGHTIISIEIVSCRLINENRGAFSFDPLQDVAV